MNEQLQKIPYIFSLKTNYLMPGSLNSANFVPIIGAFTISLCIKFYNFIYSFPVNIQSMSFSAKSFNVH